jgi:F-type H+-transporting ATPase subunit b
MHIDWFVLLAQIVNFMILVWLLKFFLYGRIIKAIDERQARLAAAREEADRMKKEAEDAAKEYDNRNRSLDERMSAMLDDARVKAEAEKAILTERARNEVDELKKAWKDTLTSEKTAFLNDLKSRAGSHVQESVRKILRDLANIGLEEQIVLSFMDRLKNADAGTLEMLRQADQETGVTVRTSFEVEEELEKKLVRYLKSLVAEGVPLIHEVIPDEIAGIELVSTGKKISWSVGEYLEDLKQRFSEALKEDIPDAPQTVTS